ncbi:MAG: hypothetical protein M0R33_03115 [Methylomonas sp.]|uniref:hypothetical protein n=1 Tax=Methylomonas sp. TaxID=418 RepID=UPI0025F63BA9|nr:hypothetical protein [Methylomonas sp.]MCK9605423.1 hypothetical protein [Methylomonas sp.]
MTRNAHHPFGHTVTSVMFPAWTTGQRRLKLPIAAIFGRVASKPSTSEEEDHHV